MTSFWILEHSGIFQKIKHAKIFNMSQNFSKNIINVSKIPNQTFIDQKFLKMFNCLNKIKSYVYYIMTAVEINSFFSKNRWLKKIVKNTEKNENDKIIFFATGNKYLIFIYGLLGVFFYKKKNIFFALNNTKNYENFFFKKLGFK
jgi:hypothetical protein